MTRADPFDTRFAEPVELAVPPSKAVLIVLLPDFVVEAVPLLQRDTGYFAGWFILRLRDESRNLIRESTGMFRTVPECSLAWFWNDDEPVEFEAWVTPIWATV